MERPLSDPQAKILDFIERYMRTEGRPPTNREIGHAVGIGSTGHVDYHLTVLEKKGYIARERKKSRGIRLAQQEQQGLRIHGTIAAGAPLDIFIDQQDVLDLSGHTREYVLLVRGESMIEDHIADGDYVLIFPTKVASDGDIIVATRRTSNGANGAATLKRFYRERDRIRLQPANSQMDPIYVPAGEWDSEWEIQGKVTAVYRRC
jgi:repressor LexA